MSDSFDSVTINDIPLESRQNTAAKYALYTGLGAAAAVGTVGTLAVPAQADVISDLNSFVSGLDGMVGTLVGIIVTVVSCVVAFAVFKKLSRSS